MAYRVTKTYSHELGLSACFRQHRATSHCRFLHGYALSFKFVFEADTLDENNWVIDFGSLKPLKQWLCDTFDHKLLVAEDDPDGYWLKQLGGIRWSQDSTNDVAYEPGHEELADVLVVPRVGCEAFARMAWSYAQSTLPELNRTARDFPPRVRLVEVECREHGANGASYTGEQG